MQDFGLASIIMPSWNCGAFVEESIRSVQAQTFGNWELLFQDDCSTDDTRATVLRMAADDQRIKYECNERNSGAAMARNAALRRARGRWIAFLDSDDLWLPEKLERQIQFMIEKAAHFSYTEYEEIDEGGHPLGRIISGPKKISRFGMFSYCWPGCLTVMYDREFIGTIQIPEIKKNNDYAMWLKVIKRTECRLLGENLAKYRKRTGSISNTNYSSLIKWHYRLFREIESANVARASLLTLNNLFWGVIKKLYYVKPVKRFFENPT